MAVANPWNWQQPDWPAFSYDSRRLAGLEAEFMRQSGVFTGAVRHVGDADQQQLTVELICDEAIHTSEIEGEVLNRESLQSSIRRNFGLTTDHRRIPPAEQGIAQMMVELYRQFDTPLSEELLHHWHRLLMNSRRDLQDVGSYRTDSQLVQIVSGPLHEPKVHFEGRPPRQCPTRCLGLSSGSHARPPQAKRHCRP